ncbi:hypothetical protein JNM05_02140 [bacterium]|nr:hypothetical protein [bacterium]
MNYLTHYYFNAQRPLYASASAEFHFGVVLPDIMSVYDRTLRFHASQIHASDNALWQGILNHLEMDSFFHRSDFFKNSYDGTRNILKKEISEKLNIRPFFLAHVLVEILLDHLLLIQSSDLARRFYKSIGAVRVKDIVHILENHFELKLDGLDDLINKFLVTRFLETYIDLNNLIYPVNRMLTRTRQQAFDINDKALVSGILQPSLLIVKDHFPELIRQFGKTFLNSQQ